MYVLEVGREVVAAARQRRNDVWPRVDRGGIYPIIRPATMVISRDVITSAISEDMIAGRPAVYADILGYDEVGHHSGIERYDVLEVLRSIDQQIGRLARVSELAPRPYQAYDPDTDEASAFEMQVASHGALGGPQSLGFLLYPSGFQAPPDPIVGAEDLHRVLLGWRTGLVESGSAFGGGVRSVDA